MRRDPTCDREVAVYGYLRGCNMKQGARVHLAGVGDYTVRGTTCLRQAGLIEYTLAISFWIEFKGCLGLVHAFLGRYVVDQRSGSTHGAPPLSTLHYGHHPCFAPCNVAAV